MNKENTLKLLNTFPKLYSNLHANYPPERKIPFEFQCRDGWFNLVWEMSQKLKEEMSVTEFYSVKQLKEKCGTLRVYMSNYTENTRDIIREAWERSKVTCEVCGEPGTLRDKRKWQFTLCDDHKDEWIQKGAGV